MRDIFNRSSCAKEGILSCGKHFPGYGPADCDPHEFLPVITKSRADLGARRADALPSALLPELDSVMTCHSNYTAFDPGRGRWPASLSHNIVTKLLRDQMGFQGLAMTDDLDMGAILNEVTFEQAIQEAVRAGNDLVMICHRLEMVELARMSIWKASKTRRSFYDALAPYRARRRRSLMPPTAIRSRYRWASHKRRRCGSFASMCSAKRLAANLSVEDGKRSPVELY